MLEALFVTSLTVTITFVGGIILANALSWGFKDHWSVLGRYVIGVLIISLAGVLFFVIGGNEMLANEVTGLALLGLTARSFMLRFMATPAYALAEQKHGRLVAPRVLYQECSNPMGRADPSLEGAELLQSPGYLFDRRV